MKNLKKMIALSLVLVLGLSLTSCGGKSSTNTGEGKLVMATSADFEPYEYVENSKIIGIDVEIMEKVAGKLGKELVIENMNFDSVLTAVTSGKADIGVSGITVTEDRLLSVDFSDTYCTAKQVIIIKDDNTSITGSDSLSGKKIGVQQGTTGDLYATGDFGEDNIERYIKGYEAVEALIQGKIDAMIIDNEPAKAYVSNNEGIKIVESAYVEEEYAFALKKGSDLTESINKAISELKEDGSIDEIFNKYIKAE